MKIVLLLAVAAASLICLETRADDGYRMWLNYKPVVQAEQYSSATKSIFVCDNRYHNQICGELKTAMTAMTGNTPLFINIQSQASISFIIDKSLDVGCEGYKILSHNDKIIVSACDHAGLLYAAFHIIRLVQCSERIDELDIIENPQTAIRLLKHWDDLNGGVIWIDVEGSIWNWGELPDKVDERYGDYARLNASIGLNAMCIMINNPLMMTPEYLRKLAAIAHVMADYNITIFMAVNFTAPMSPDKISKDKQKYSAGIGNLHTADPCDADVAAWWRDKVDEIYSYIPDFKGFIVKANSEGMPGPLDYGRSYADGANVIARALKPHNGVVLWRTFVYNKWVDDDRAKRAYKEFLELDGKFDDNVVLLTKNGPIDFQPREPVHPLFGGMRKTQVMPELQIMQEYLGQQTYAVYLLPMWREFMNFDTYANNKGSTVKSIVEGKVFPYKVTAMAGVSNMGRARNWTTNHFAQANWYAFGRLAWNPDCDDRDITRQWIKMTWNCDKTTTDTIEQMMNGSWSAYADANSPYAMGITSSSKNHYSPAFESRNGRTWRADSTGIGENRSSTGSNYVSQYYNPNRELFDNITTCPEELLLFFHFVEWEHKMCSGKELRQEIEDKFGAMVTYTEKSLKLWHSLEGKIDAQRYGEVNAVLEEQLAHALQYRNAAMDYIPKYSVGVTPNFSLKLRVK